MNPKSVVFRVRPNGRGLNASDVAKNIEKIKDRLKGVEITSVGVGDKVSRNKFVFIIAIRRITENDIFVYNVDTGFVRLCKVKILVCIFKTY